MRLLVIGPHPDDELLGCGGTLLRRKSEGVTIGWLLMTEMTGEDPDAQERMERRDAEIDRVREGLGIAPQNLWRLGHATTTLDRLPVATLVSEMSRIISDFGPEEVLVPHPGDAHTDHRVTFDAAISATKWFRQPTVQRVFAYETPSETGFAGSAAPAFVPHIMVDISAWLDDKVRLLSVYASELGAFPFPRSAETIRALAAHRGSSSGFSAAEAYQVVRWRSPAAA